jgi:hypothetical protein
MAALIRTAMLGEVQQSTAYGLQRLEGILALVFKSPLAMKMAMDL